MARKPSVWNEENIKWLEKNYKYGNIDACAKHFNVTRPYIMKVASKYGISSGRFLTEKQKKIMESKSNRSNQYFMKIFGRDNGAIRSMRSNYCVGTIIESNEDKLNCAEVGRIVGKDKSTIAKCWCKAGLEYEYVGKRYKMIRIDKLKKFMRENPKKWDATECEAWFFNKDKWFQEKLKADSLKKRQKRWGEYYEVI